MTRSNPPPGSHSGSPSGSSPGSSSGANHFLEAVKREIKRQGLTVRAVARKAFGNSEALNKNMSGKYEPRLSRAEAICRVLGWELTYGPPYGGCRIPVLEFGSLPDKSLFQPIRDVSQNPSHGDVSGDVSGDGPGDGPGGLNPLASLPFLDLSSSFERYIAFRVLDDAMHPTLERGDYMVVDRLPAPRWDLWHGKVCLVETKKEGYFQICRLIPELSAGFYMLRSDNRLYPELRGIRLASVRPLRFIMKSAAMGPKGGRTREDSNLRPLPSEGSALSS